jgi:hypothetical protein
MTVLNLEPLPVRRTAEAVHIDLQISKSVMAFKSCNSDQVKNQFDDVTRRS